MKTFRKVLSLSAVLIKLAFNHVASMWGLDFG